MLTLVLPAQADPWADPAAQAMADAARAAGREWDVFYGVGFDTPTDVADKSPTPIDSPEGSRGGWTPIWAVRPGLSLGFGNQTPDNLGGDPEAGPFSVRVRPGLAGYAGPFAVRVSPELGLDLTDPSVRWRVWGGVDTKVYTLGFGKQDRWIGPGRHANLLLSDNAEPPWMGTGAIEGRLPWKFAVLGRLRAEVGVGWLDRPRTDVANPGVLLMDVRWRPVAYGELGVTRLSMFGGEGRPAVDVGQLLIPSEPHIYDDPDKELPDQNEQASIDLRVTIPLQALVGGPVRYLEGWWEYGGEDMIVRELGPIPYPALAGVANLYGGEIGVGPLTVTGEYAALMDDYFRWYTGHRVYHQGFTQDGRAMGAFTGGDAEMVYGALRWDDPRFRARLWADKVRRVGVIEAQNDHVFVLSTEEHRWRIGVDGGLPLPHGGYVSAGYSLQRREGIDFVPGASADEHRVTLSWSPAVTVRGEGGQARW